MSSCLPWAWHLGRALWLGIFLLSLQELKLWVKKLRPEGGSNLLQALRKIFTLKELNSLVTIMRSW